MKNGISLGIDDLEVGMEADHERTVSRNDISAFADISGDHNPVHIDEDFAATTRFKTCIAHGMLTASFISTVLGTKLPGMGSIYLSQTLRFKAPVHVGDTVRTHARITKLDRERRHVELACACEVGGKRVLEGEAVILIPARA